MYDVRVHDFRKREKKKKKKKTCINGSTKASVTYVNTMFVSYVVFLFEK